MPKEILPQVSGKELKLMEVLLSEGYIEHKYAVRLQAVINRAKNVSTNTIS